MKRITKYITYIFFLIISIINTQAQEVIDIQFNGQLTDNSIYAFENDIQLGGVRYMPELRLKKIFKNTKSLDLEISANIHGSVEHNYNTKQTTWDGEIRPYRAYIRYTTEKCEFRVGCQKINFGSAQLLRPLMWFDQVDPKDPLKLTDGLWAALFRYYFPNNSNLWIWGLGGNKDLKGWEVHKTALKFQPEIGGRFQQPVPLGEVALSYNYRKIKNINEYPTPTSPEHRIGMDLRLDYVVGMWAEANWTHQSKTIPNFKNQTAITLGFDYTFPWKNGLNIIIEQLYNSFGNNIFNKQTKSNYTALRLNYPLNLFNTITTIAYYNWEKSKITVFTSWEKRFNNITLHLSGQWSPGSSVIPGQVIDSKNNINGSQLQCIFVWYH